jgi:hypothetical protein
MRVSPGRIGDLLREKSQIKITDDGDIPFEGTRLKKAVAGFAASIERILNWLKREKLLPEDALTTEEVVKAYWPADQLDVFERPEVREGLADGRASAQNEHDQLNEIKAELWTIAWGPIGDEEDANAGKGFLPEYAKDLVKGVDPFAEFATVSKSLPQLLGLPPRDRKKGLTLGLGLCETLYRKFLGFEFVTLPLAVFPILCLHVSRRTMEEQFSVEAIASGAVPLGRARLTVIQGDMGQALLDSLIDVNAHEEPLPVESPSSVADELWKLTDPKKDLRPIILFSDGIAALDAFVRLAKSGAQMKVSAQPGVPQFAFSLGIMLRKEDKDLASLLELSQLQMMRSSWRVERHLQRLLVDLENWALKQGFDKAIDDQWPDDAPILHIPGGLLEEHIVRATGSTLKGRQVTQKIQAVVEARRTGSPVLRKLVKFVELES